MKLKSFDYESQITSDEDVKEIKFGIRVEDTGKILDILRSKMYKNPIGAICREVSCNSRDANREAKKENEPITIQIENNYINESQPVIKFVDTGVGISPDRMADVFCNYGASTKTNTNKLTGGFGLGAKTPFSYSDSFYIETIFNKVKYHYMAVLDPAGTGKIILLSQEQVTDKNGTTIAVPIQEKDIKSFEQEVINYTQFWKVRPTLIGFTQTYQPLDLVYSFEDKLQIICKESNHVTLSSVKILIDDIPYDLDIDQIQQKDEKIIDYWYHHYEMILPFKNGELSVSSNRETLYYDESTIKKIKSKLQFLKKEVKSDFELTFQSLPSFKEACVYLNRNQALINFFHKIFEVNCGIWRGEKVISLEYNDSYIFKTINLSEKDGFFKAVVSKNTDTPKFSNCTVYITSGKLKTSQLYYLYKQGETKITFIEKRKKLNRYESTGDLSNKLQTNDRRSEFLDLKFIDISLLPKEKVTRKQANPFKVPPSDKKISYKTYSRLNDLNSYRSSVSDIVSNYYLYFYQNEIELGKFHRINRYFSEKVAFINARFKKSFEGQKFQLFQDVLDTYQKDNLEHIQNHYIWNQTNYKDREFLTKLNSFSYAFEPKEVEEFTIPDRSENQYFLNLLDLKTLDLYKYSRISEKYSKFYLLSKLDIFSPEELVKEYVELIKIKNKVG